MRKTSLLKNKKTEQVHLCMGTGGPSQLDDDRYAFASSRRCWAASMSSRLFQEVREKRGLAYSIYAYNSAMKDCGLFIVYAGTSKENYGKVIDLTSKELADDKEERHNKGRDGKMQGTHKRVSGAWAGIHERADELARQVRVLLRQDGDI